MGKKIGIAVGIIILVAALIVCLIPLKTAAYTVMVDYQVNETYTETVPVEIAIIEHHLVKEDYLAPPFSFTWTFVRGKVKNTSNVTLASFDVNIWVKYQVEGLEGRLFSALGLIDLEPATFKPGELRDFEVHIQNEAKEGYTISVETGAKTTVEKQRTVTKQRPETRYKEVTLLDYCLHY
jgi:hypothetical protein